MAQCACQVHARRAFPRRRVVTKENEPREGEREKNRRSAGELIDIAIRIVVLRDSRGGHERFSRGIRLRYDPATSRSLVLASRTVETQPGDYTLHGGILSKRVTSIGLARRS